MPCDRCGRNAHPYGWAATNRDGRTLTLCLHHFTDHRESLVKQNWTVYELAAIEPERLREMLDGADAAQG